MLAGKKRNMAYRIGSWISMGTQPLAGFTPALRYRSITACCFFSWSPSLYFSVMASCSGFSAFILALLFRFL